MLTTRLFGHVLCTDDTRCVHLLETMVGRDEAMRGPALQAFTVEYRAMREAAIACLAELDVGCDGSAVVIYKNGRVQVWPRGDRGPSAVRKLVGETHVIEG